MTTKRKSGRIILLPIFILLFIVIYAFYTTEQQISERFDAVSASGLLVCVDAGHGGKDPGGNRDGRLESDDNLRLALALKTALEKQGCRVLMTRSDDTFLTLEERCAVANNAGADYFLCLHRNIIEGEAYGVEVWRSHSAGEESIALSESIMNGLENVGIQRNRGVQVGSRGDAASDFYVLQYTKMPCSLLEMGFLNDEEDNRLFDENLERYAEAIADAVTSTYQEFHGEEGE